MLSATKPRKPVEEEKKDARAVPKKSAAPAELKKESPGLSDKEIYCCNAATD